MISRQSAPSAETPELQAATASLVQVALALCVVSQVYLALRFGALTGASRSSWSVALTLCAALSLPTALLLFACWRSETVRLPSRLWSVIALAGLLMRLPYLGCGPLLEDDQFRYLLDGAMTARGLNPYAYAPETLLAGGAPTAYLSAIAEGRATLAQINFPDLRTMYPGAAQLLFALAHVLKPWGVDGLRAIILVCEILTALLCWRLLDVLALPRHLVALIWCNPLLAFSLTGQAHIDAALGPLLLAGVLAALRSSGAGAAAAVGLAIGVKLWPVMLTPLFLRALGQQRATQAQFLLAMGLIAALACGPLLLASFAAANTGNSGLVAYANRWHMNNMPYEWVSYGGYLVAGGAGLERYLRVIVGLIGAGIGVAMAARPLADTRDLIGRLALVSAAVFYLSPAQFPWYAFWFLPFAALARNWALLSASVGLASYFLFFPLAGTVWGDLYRFWLSGLHLLPVLVVLALQRSRTRDTA